MRAWPLTPTDCDRREQAQVAQDKLVSASLKEFEVERSKRLAEEADKIAQKREDSVQGTRDYFKGLREMKARVSCRKMLFEQATQDNLRQQVTTS